MIQAGAPEQVPTTIDALLDGAVSVEQPAPGTGYRVNVDSVHLARFAAPCIAPGARVLDLGAGVGALALCIAHLGSPGRLMLVDADQHACTLAQRNLVRAGWANRSDVVHADLTAWQPSAASAEAVVMNPPYTPSGTGRPAGPAVRHAREGDVTVFLRAAAHAVVPGGQVSLCYPSHALVRLMTCARTVGLAPARICFVFPGKAADARLVMVSCVAGAAREIVVVPSIVEGRPTRQGAVECAVHNVVRHRLHEAGSRG